MKVLIVDNNRNSRDLLEHMLDMLEVGTVTKVSSGAKAVECLKKEVYDVAFLDIRMPVLNGLETAKIIKEDSSCHKVNLVALTAGTEGHFETEKEHALACGFDEYILKPFTLSDLKKLLTDLVLESEPCA